MASTPEQRQLDERAAFSARFGLSRVRVLAAVAALVVAAVTASSVVLAQLAGWRAPEHPVTPGFLATALGAPQADAPLVREPAAGVAVTIDETGFKVMHRDASLGVSSDTGSGPWTTFEHGAVRATPYGSETIAVERTKTEQYLTVVERQGRKTWRWRLETPTLEPRLRRDGAVELLGADGGNSGLTILPAAILDPKGRNITPASTRWSLDRDDRGWLLELDLDDSPLPLPYVIDPASAYPSPLELRNTATSETGSWDLDSGTGTVDTTTDNIPNQNATGWYAFNPGTSNTTQLATLPTTTDGMGWIVDPVGGATGFPAGTWSFTVQTDIPNGTFVAGTAVMTVGVWKGTVSGGVFTSTGTILTPTDDSAAQNIRPNVNTNTFTVSYSLPKISLAAGETLFVDYWRHQTGGISATQAARRQLDFYVNDGIAQITHPAADDAGPTHSVSLAPSPTGAHYAGGRLYYKSDAAGSFAFRDALTDTAGTGTAASGMLDLDYPAIATTGWTHNAETVTTSPNYQSSSYTWTASPSNPADQTLTAEDNALQQSTSVVQFVADTTAPTGGALTVNGVAASGGASTSYDTTGSFTIATRTDYAETQSATAAGLLTSTLTRENGTLSANGCSAYGAPTTLVGAPAQGPFASGCYRFTLTGTDNVGNAVSITTTVKVDTSAPSVSGVTVGSLSNTTDSAANGSTFYYRPAGSGGTFAVSTAASDGESGLGNATYPALAGGFTPASSTGIAPPSPYSRTYTWPATTGTDTGSKTIAVANNAGGSTNTSFAIVSDSTAPAGGALTVNSVAASGGGSTSYDTDGSFTIGTRTDYAETQSGTAAGLRTSTLTRENGTLSGNACSAYGAPTTLVGAPAQGPFATGCYRYTLTGTDNVGNAVSVTTTVKVDTSGPSVASVTVGSVSNANDSFASGSTFYYRPAGSGGTFAVATAASDGDSGLGNATYPALAGGFTPASSAGIAPPSPYSRTYTWPATTGTDSGLKTVSVANNAAGASTQDFRVVSDSTAPTGGALTVNGVAASGGGTTGYDTDGSFTIGTRTDYAETLSAAAAGLRSSTLTREDGTLSADACSSYGLPATLVGTPAQNGLATGCYRYVLTGTDNVGNAVSITTTVKVDTSTPTISGTTVGSVSNTADSYAGGSTFYYRPAGSGGTFAVDVAASDGESGLANATYPALGGGFTPASPAGVAPPSPYSRTYSWPATTGSESGSKTVSVANSASGSTTTNGSFSIVADSTAPTGGALTVNSVAASGGGTTSYDTDGSFAIGTRTDWGETLSGTAAGLRSSTLAREDGTLSADACSSYGGPATLVGSPAQNGLTTGCYRYTLTGTDNVGNTVTITTVVKVDTTAPTSAADALSTYATSTSITVGYSTNDAATGVDSVQLWVDGPGAGGYALADTDTTPASPSFSFTAAEGDGLYRFYTRASDEAGNTEAAPGGPDATTTVDTASPASSADALAAYSTSASLAVPYTASDATSGVDEVELWIDGPGAGGYALADTDTTPASPSFSFTAAEGQGTYRFYTRARDDAGNTESAPGAEDASTVLDSVAPTSAADALPAYSGATVAVTYTASDATSGVDEVELWIDGPGAGGYALADTDTTPASPSFSYDTTEGDGTYRFYTRARDNAGTTETAPGSEDAATIVDTTDPVSAAAALPAFTSTNTFAVAYTASDATSGVDEVELWVDGPGAGGYALADTDTTPASPSFSFTAADGDGTYRFYTRARDNAGTTEAAPGSEDATTVVDTTNPVSAADALPASTGTTSIAVTYTSSDTGGSGVDEVELWAKGPSDGAYVLADTDTTPGSASFAYTASQGDGTYRFYTRARDVAGNTEAAPGSEDAATVLETSPPTAPSLSLGSFTNASATGTTVYVREGASGGFTVTADAADPDSGVASHAFPSFWGEGGSVASDPAATAYTFGTSDTAPAGAQTVTATNGAGLTGPGSSFTVVADTLAPVTTPSAAPAANGNGWHTSQPVNVTLSANDGGSGIAAIRYTTDGSDPTALSPLYAGAIAVTSTTTVKFRAWDAVGNVESVGSLLVQVDTTAPVAPSLAVSGLTAAFESGGTVWYRPAAGTGEFTVSASTSDAESGVASYAFPAPAVGWSRSFAGNAATYTHAGAPTDPAEPNHVTATNGAGLASAAASFTVSPDATAPSVTAPTVAGGFVTSASVPVTLNGGSDGESGVAPGSSVVERQEALLDNGDGSCDGFGGWTTVTLSGGADTTVAHGRCYRYRELLTDRVGNEGTSPASAVAKVDTTAPAAPSLAFSGPTAAYESGGTVWYRPSAAAGSFTVTATATDAESGIASVGFPAAAGGWTRSLAVNAATYDHTGSPTDPAEPNDVTATNGAGLASAPTAYTVSPDATAPSVTAPTVTGGFTSTLSVPVTLNGATDAESGVAAASSVVQRDEAPLDNADGSCDAFAGSWGTVTLTGGADTTVASGTCYRYRELVTDRVGNQGTSTTSVTVKVDATAPTGDVTAPTAGANVRGTVAVTSDSGDTGAGVAGVAFERRPSGGGAWVSLGTDATAPYSVSWATGGEGDGQYDVRVVTTDAAGNTRTSPALGNVRVDNTDPAVGLDALPAAIRNGFALTGSASDGGSGVDDVEYLWCAGAGCTPSTSIGSSATGPAYSVTWGSQPTDGTVRVLARASDAAGNATDSAVQSVVVDNTAPTGSVTAPAAGANVRGTVTVTTDSADTGSGVATVTFQRSPANTGTWTTIDTDTGAPYNADWNTGTDGLYDLRAVTTDAAGNTTTSALVEDVRVDNTAPSGSVTAPAAGANVRGTVTVTTDSADTGSGVATVAFQRSPANADTWTTIDTDTTTPYNADWNTGTDGLYDLRAVTTDAAGNTTTSALVEDVRVDNTAPSSTLTFPAASGSYNAAGWDGGCASPGLCGTASDGGSGLASVEVSIRQQGGDWYDGSAFTSMSEAWLPATGTGAWERAFASTEFPADGTFAVRVRATDAAGNVETPSSTAFTTDAVAPTTTIDSTPADPTSATGASFAFSSNETATFECRVDGAASFTTCTSPETFSGLADGSHTFRVRAVDGAGNVDPTPALFTWTVDTSAPSAPSLSFGSLAGAAVTGSTVFYRPSAPAGAFTVTASSTDAGSGVASYGFPAVASGWSRSVSGTDATYSHTGSPTEPGPGDVTATNGAGLTSSPTSFTVTADASAPTGMSATVTGGYRTAASVAVSVATGSDTGSGLSLGTLVLERDDAGLTGDACDPFTGAWSAVTLSAGNDTSVASGTCVRYRVRISDRVGNEGASAPSATVKIDTSAPSTPSLAFSNETNAATGGPSTVWYRPATSGGFTLTASATDAQSGIALYAFPSLGAGWASSGSGAAHDYSYSGTPAEPGAQSLTAQNGAGTDSAATGFSVLADATAPVTTPQCDGAACSAGYSVTQPVSVTLGATDAESGVAQVKYTTDGSDPSPVNGTVYAGAISVAATTTVKFRAYDRVGNEELVGTVLVRIDTTTPSVPALTLSETDPGSYISGTTLFYNPSGANSGTFTVDATATDAESGVDKVAFPALAGMTGGGDDSSPAFQGSYAWTASSTATGAQTVTVHNGAGLTSSGSFTLVQDATAPTSSIACDGAACSAGWYTSSPVSVTLAASDAGSGLASLRYTLDGSDPTSGTPYTAAFDVAATATVRWAALDQVGNLDTGSQLVRIDTTAPSAPNLSFGSFANASATGSTVFFRPGNTGGFTVTAATADGGSGVQHVAFPALGANWTGGGNDTGAPYAQAYTFDASAADPAEPNDVVARNGAGLDSAATPFTVTADATAPTTTIACDGGPCPGGWTTSAADVTLSADDGSGSGVAEIRYTLDGSDPLASGTLYTGAFSVAATTTVRFAAVDAVGNAEAVGSQLLQIDDSKPTTPTLAFSAPTNAHWDGSVLWFRAGAAGGFTVTPSSSDAQSGIAAYHFPALGSGWSNTGGDYTFAGGAADPAEPNDVTAENAAGLVSDPASFTVTVDGAAPTGASATVTGGATATLSVAVATTGGTDAGSGVDAGSLVVERQEADLGNGDGTCDAFGSWTTVTLTAGADTGVVSGKCFRYRVRSSDLVGNEATSAASVTVQVDTAAPSVTLNDPGANLAGTVTLSATATDAASGIASVVFQRSPADAGTWTTITGSWDTTSVADGLYDLRAIATDAAGNATTSAVVEDRRVDNVSPDTTIDSAPADPDNDATPTFVFSSNESGSTFQCRFDGGAWSVCASPLTAGALPDGARTFEVRAIDASANPDASPASHAWVLDTVAPSGGSITVADGWDTDGSVAIATDNGTDAGGSGVAAASAVVEREAATLTTGTCGSYDAAWSAVATPDASVAGGACYRYRLRVRDNAGNWVTYPSASVVKVDLTAPTVPSLTLANVSGTQVAGTTAYFRPGTSGSFTATPVSNDPESGGVTFSNPNLGTGWSRAGTTWSFDATAGDPNEPNNVTATNAAGLTSGAASFTVTADAAAPVTTASAAPSVNGFGWHTASPVSVTLSAADGGSGVKEIRYTTDGSLPGPTSPLYAAPVDIVGPGTTTLTFRAEDNLGNLEAPATLVVRIDTTAPTTPTLAYSALANASFDGTVTWFRPDVAGGFTVTPSASDPESGIASHAFPALGSGWSNTGGTYAFTAATADPVEPNEVVTTNGAGLTSAGAPITVTADSTAPLSTATCNAAACSAGWYTAKPVTVVLTASDVQSGLDRIDWSTDGSAPANEYLAPLSLGVEGTTTVRIASRDNVGNVETAVSQDVRIDTVAPAAAMGAVAPYLRGTVALTSTQSDATSGVGSVQFQIAPAGTGIWTNVPATWDTTGTANGQYDVRVRVTDLAGNVTDSAPVASVWVDNLAPSIALDPPASPASGSVLLTSTANDAHSGLDAIEYEYSAAGANDWRTTALTGALWDTTQLADGDYDLRARATDRSGNVSGWSAVTGIAVDNAPPTVSVTAPLDGSFVNAADADPFTLTAAASDAGTGVASVEFLACTTVGPTCSSWTSVDLDTSPAYTGAWTLPGDGVRQVKAVATDNAGHTAEAVVTVTVDRTAPAASLTAPSAGANVRGTVVLTASATDATSGVDSVAFQRSPAGSSSWTTIPSSWDTTSVSDGLYDVRILVTDVAGNTQTDVAANVRVDNTAPTGTLTDPGQFLRGSLALSGNAADAGSGITSVAFQRSPEGAGTWTAIATDTNGGDGWSATFDTTAGGTPDGRYDLRVLVTDNAGNTFAHALPGRTVDNTNPTAAIANPGANLRLTVTLGGTAADVTAGVATVAFEYDNGGGWQLISTDTDGSDGWTASLNTTLPATPDGLYAFRLVATDRAGNQDTSSIGGRRIDNTAPTASMTDPGPYLMGAVQLTSAATDGGSGIDVVRFERSAAGSGGPWTQVGPDASFSAGAWRSTWNTSPDGLYDLRVVVDDLAANRTVDAVASRRVDNTAPVTTDDAAPGRHNTDQTVTLSRSDAGSGPSATQHRVRPPGGSFGAWQPGTSVSIFASAGDGVWTIEYYSTDAAGNVESVKSTDVLIDTTGPSGTVTDPSTFLRGLVTLTATADDPADVSSVAFEYAPAGSAAWTQIGTDLTANGSDEYTIDWDTTAVADIAYDLQVTFLDSVGNPTVQSLTGKTVDNELPTIALTAPPAGSVRRNVIAITANAADGVSGMREVRFEVKPAGAAGFSQVDVDNGSSPYSTAWDSTTSPDGPTDLRVIAVDQAGNLRSATTTIFVDNNAPTLTVSAPSTAVSGTVTLTATGSSDIQSVIFEVGGSPIGTDTDGSNGFSVSWSTVGDGNQVVTAEATDVGGNVGTSAPVTVQVDNTAPTGAMTQPANGATVSGSVSLAASASDAGSGVSGTSFEFKATSDATWTAVGGSSWNTTSLATGAYNLRARITDNAGNAALTAAITVQVVPPALVVVPPAPPATPPATPAPSDPAPTVVAATPADGSVLTESPVSIDVTASEPLSAVTGLTLNGSPVDATIAGASFSVEPDELDTGAYTLAGTLVDGTGKTIPFRLHFTVVLGSPAALPFVEANVPNGTATSLTAADGASVVTVPAGAVVGGGDWLVVRIQPLPASSVPTAPAGAPTSVVDVTARWALAGTEVHSFFVPLEIVLPGASAALVPATLEDGRWRALEPVAGGTSLPLLARDGYVREGARVRILTRHLSVFGLIPAPRLVLTVAAAKTFSWSTRRYVAARVKVSRAATVTATLIGPRGGRLAAWRRNVPAGASVVKLPLPRTARTPGAYRILVAATAGGQTARRTLGLRVVRKDGSQRTTGPVQVALAGDTRIRRTLALGLRGTRTRVIAADADGAFALAANRGVRVVLVDVDRHGTALVRDLNAVFPTLRLLALASRSADLRAATRAGADAALPRSASSARIARAVRRLAR